MWLNGNGYEPTCINPELKPRYETKNHISKIQTQVTAIDG